MAKKASIGKLESLHNLLAEYFIGQLDSGEELSSGTLAAINSFLKNNDISVDIVESNPLQNLNYKVQSIIKAQEA